MSIPLYALLILYLFFVAIFYVFAAFNIYHIVRFTVPFFFMYAGILAYLAVGAGIILTTLYFTNGIDWAETIQLLPSFAPATL